MTKISKKDEINRLKKIGKRLQKERNTFAVELSLAKINHRVLQQDYDQLEKMFYDRETLQCDELRNDLRSSKEVKKAIHRLFIQMPNIGKEK